MGEEMILQREKDREARRKDAVETKALSEENQLQILTLMEKEKENTNSLVEMVDNLYERLNVVGSEVARLAGGQEEMNDLAGQLGRIAIQEQAPQASKAEE